MCRWLKRLTTKTRVNRVIKKNDGVVNKFFVALGYDIELTYGNNTKVNERQEIIYVLCTGWHRAVRLL